MLIQLPNGLIDGTDLFNYADVDELRGKQQNYLANQDLVVGNIGHVPKILEDMILSLQTKEGLKWKGDVSKAIWKLPTGDIETILINIRKNTYGGKFYHVAECTHCNHEMGDLLLQLEDLKTKPFDLTEMIKSKHITLPKAKVEVEVKPTYLKDIFDMIKITTGKKDKLVTSLIPLSIKSIKSGTKEEPVITSPINSSHIEDLPVSDLLHLQDQLDKTKVEGSIDTTIEIECSECHKEFETKLNVFDSTFFDPTKGSTSGSM